MSTPFSYYLYHKPTQKHYYGIRHGKNANPDTLWKTYFSSSKIVKQLIAEYGADSFTVEVRKTFSTSQDAILWEHKVLRRLGAASREDWINRHNGGKKFRGPAQHTEEAKSRISRRMTGFKRSPENIQKFRELAAQREQKKKEEGWKMPESGKANISAALKRPEVQAKIYTPERNAKMAELKKGTKRHYLPDGSFIMVRPQADQ
jgi:hypothetical protein